MAEILGDIDYRRGDSYPLVLYVKDKETGQRIDITDYAFLFTVNEEKDPTDASKQVFQVTGVVDPDQVTNIGKVSFTPTTTDTDSVGKFYFDIQITDPSGNIKTPVKYKFNLGQDITK